MSRLTARWAPISRVTREVGGLALAFLCLLTLAPEALSAEKEEAQYNVVVSLYNAGQLDAALKKIDEREDLELSDTMQARYLHVQGLIQEQAERPQLARQTYEALLKKFPDAPESQAARTAVVYIDYAAGRTDPVIENYALIKQDALSAEEKRDLALMYAEALATQEDLDRTISAYQQAVALGADSGTVNPRLFELYLQTSRHTDLLSVSSEGIPGAASPLVAVARAEAHFALKQYAAAATEAQKVPADHELHPRASYTRAQALIAQNKPADAAEPLAAAIAGMKTLPSPAATRIALADCWIEAGNPEKARQALREAEPHLASLDTKAADDLRYRMLLIELRLAGKDNEPERVVEAIDKARPAVPAERLPDLLYRRLYALTEMKNRKAILQSFEEDYPVLQKSSSDGAATLIYFQALKEAGRRDEALGTIESFVTRRPTAPEALRARVELANAHTAEKQYDQAASLLDEVASSGNAEEVLGKDAYHDVLYNRALLAMRDQDAAKAIRFLTSLVNERPAETLLGPALKTLGQAYVDQKDYAKAAEALRQALTQETAENEAVLRERLARALFLARDYAGAEVELQSIATKSGGEDDMSKEAAELWARALYETKRYADAAVRHRALYKRFKRPVHAYECGACFEKADQHAEAAGWYETARRFKKDLPESYARDVDILLAQARFASGSEDMGADYWIDQLGAGVPDDAFAPAVSMLVRIAGANRLAKKQTAALEKSVKSYALDVPRRYSVAAVFLSALAQDPVADRLTQATAKFAGEFARAEPKLPEKDFGTTVAAAMIYFYRGQALLQTGHAADAMAAYETVLSVYPYNEWPDAASCGVAEAFAALGDTDTAIARFEAVVKAGGEAPGSKRWKQLAEKRIAELRKGQ